MIKLLRQNKLFFGAYLLLFIIVGLLQLLYTKEELMRWINGHNNTAADLFFENITFLGDGAFSVIVAVALAFASFRYAVLGIVSFLVSGGISSVLKHYVFSSALRPLKYFEHSKWQYRVIEGLDIHSYNSFPSGHTITAFATFTLIALIDDRKGRSWFWLTLAVLTAYSRVYLFQHFVEDVYAGSVIGALSSLLVVWGLMRYWDKNPRSWHSRKIRSSRQQQ